MEENVIQQDVESFIAEEAIVFREFRWNKFLQKVSLELQTVLIAQLHFHCDKLLLLIRNYVEEDIRKWSGFSIECCSLSQIFEFETLYPLNSVARIKQIEDLCAFFSRLSVDEGIDVEMVLNLPSNKWLNREFNCRELLDVC